MPDLGITYARRESTYNLLMAMVIIRILVMWLMIIISLIIFIAWLLVFILSGCKGPIPFLNEQREGGEESEQNQVRQQQRLQQMQRIPVLGNFLAARARAYDPKVHEGDIITKECCICFD